MTKLTFVVVVPDRTLRVWVRLLRVLCEAAETTDFRIVTEPNPR